MSGGILEGARRTTPQWSGRFLKLLPKSRAKVEAEHDDSMQLHGWQRKTTRTLFKLKRNEFHKEDSAPHVPPSPQAQVASSCASTVDSTRDTERELSPDQDEKSSQRRKDKKRSLRVSAVARRSLSNVLSVSSTVSNGNDQPTSSTISGSVNDLENRPSEDFTDEAKSSKIINWVMSPVRWGVERQSGKLQIGDLNVLPFKQDPDEQELLEAVANDELQACIIEEEELSGLPSRLYEDDTTATTDAVIAAGGLYPNLKAKSTSLRVYGTPLTDTDAEENYHLKNNKRTLSVSAPSNNWFNMTINPSARGETGDLATLSREASARKKQRSQSQSRNNSFVDSLKSPHSRTPNSVSVRTSHKKSSQQSNFEVGRRELSSNPGSPRLCSPPTSPLTLTGSQRFDEPRAENSPEPDDYSQFMQTKKKTFTRLLSNRNLKSRDASTKNFRGLLTSKTSGNDDDGNEPLSNGHDEFSPFETAIASQGKPRSPATTAEQDVLNNIRPANSQKSIAGFRKTRL